MRLIVAITGSSGAIYGVRLLEALRAARKAEVHLVISKAGRLTLALETGRKVKEVEKLTGFTFFDKVPAETIGPLKEKVDEVKVKEPRRRRPKRTDE